MDAYYTGNIIAERRKALGLTQKALAEQLHVTDKAVSKWERGINFPDLGVMEALAKALDTTPAVLLGLEDADRDEIVKNMAQVHEAQLEEAHGDLRTLGWLCVVFAVLTICAYWLFYDRDARETKLGYPFLNVLTMTAANIGWWFLRKYGDIKCLEPEDLGIIALALIPLTGFLGCQFLTGRSPATFWSVILIGLTAAGIQWLMYRIFRPAFVKALPMVCTLLFAFWHVIDGHIPPEFYTPALCCTAVWILCRLKRKKPV